MSGSEKKGEGISLRRDFIRIARAALEEARAQAATAKSGTTHEIRESSKDQPADERPEEG